jgi:hypothetical protein
MGSRVLKGMEAELRDRLTQRLAMLTHAYAHTLPPPPPLLREAKELADLAHNQVSQDPIN